MSASLVGSEMCIRDRGTDITCSKRWKRCGPSAVDPPAPPEKGASRSGGCLLYTSDAADDM
eukprot:785837-Alexandrium_andersonii.AAC.1